MGVRASDCELWGNGGWHLRTIEQVLGWPREKLLRCVECHGRVKWHKAGADNVPPAHFEHYVRHPGCSRCDQHDGSRSPHPSPATPKGLGSRR